MLHLAQVYKIGFSSQAGLQLLAAQKSETMWVLLTDPKSVVVPEANAYGDDVLVLVELSNNNQVVSIQLAHGWILELIQKFLASGITPDFLHQETERAEQWRQSLTLQSQELDRRALELEARREQIQALEEDLKQKQRDLEQATEQLNHRELTLTKRLEACE
jgi:hypothetical protein